MTKLNNSFTGHHVLEKGKSAEIRKFINAWLADQAVYCNNCGLPYAPWETQVCCEKPQIGKNIQHCQALLLQIDAQRKETQNDFASNSGKTMRFGISLPPDLMTKLERFSQERFGHKLFETKKDLREFMKSFPQFTTARRI